MNALVDPPVRADGRCALESCGKPRKVTAAARKYAGDQLDLDPFCSSMCCRRFHGIVFPSDREVDEDLAEARSQAASEQNRRRKFAAGVAS